MKTIFFSFLEENVSNPSVFILKYWLASHP